MIISKTPFRISFFGGGSDYPDYYLSHGGKVLGSTIDKYCYLNIRHLPPYFEYKHKFSYSKYEMTDNFEQIQHPSIRETLKFLDIQKGLSINHDGDIPARSGMGSSSSFTVGLLNGLYALQGKMISKNDLANQAIHIEQNLINENVGSQDQTFASFGGLNIIEFLQNGQIKVNPIIISQKRLKEFQNNLLLFFTGISRTADEIADEQIKKISINVPNINKMKNLVDQAYEILINENISLDNFGYLLNDTWKLKKTLSSKISNDCVDELYEKALCSGALGGKLLGAGGGGFMLFYVPKKNQENLIKNLNKYLHIPFKFEFEGSKIIVYVQNYKEKQ